MTEPRIAPLAPPYAEPVAADLAAMMPPGMEPLALFRTLAHNPRVLARIRGGNLLDRGSIERRDREIVILRTTALCGSEYEWGVHVAFFAERVGLGSEQVRATVGGGAEAACWSERDRALLCAADALHASATMPDQTYALLAEHFDPAQIVEIVVLCGFYHTISFVTGSLGVPLEPGAPRFADFGA